MAPEVSIITPVFNSKRFIQACLDSVASQTFRLYEHIIIIDKSTDGTEQIIEKYAKTDKRIKIYWTKGSCGSGASRNLGIENAKGKYIAFLDSDDIWTHNKLEEQIKFMKQNRIHFSYTKYFIENTNTHKISVFHSKSFATYKELLKNNFIGCSTVIYDSEVLGKIFSKQPYLRTDYSMWLQILRKVDYGQLLPLELATYKIHDNGISRNKISALYYNFKVLYFDERISFLKTIYYLFCQINYILFKKRNKRRLR